MKKVFLAVTILLFALQLEAQDTLLLKHIKEANSQVTTLKANLHNHNVKGEKVITKDGRILYIFSDKFAALFDNGTYMIVNGNRIKVNAGLFRGNFKMREGPIRSLSKAFLYAFQGRCQDLAEENNYSLQTETDKQYHIVTFTNKKKFLIGIGIKQAFFKFSLDDLLIKEIVLIDHKNHVDTYSLSNEEYNGKIEESDFKF